MKIEYLFYVKFTATDPFCSTYRSSNGIAEQDDHVTLTCSVNYAGNWAPVMKWHQDGGSVITVGVVDDTVPNKSVTSSLTVLVSANKIGIKFTCTTYFSDSEGHLINQTGANNVPEYSYTWTSSYINVSKPNYNITSFSNNSSKASEGSFNNFI